MKQRVRGVYAPITTPFLANGELDAEGLRQNMAYYAGTGLHGYLALGSNGENKSLGQEEKLEVLRIVMQHKRADQKVMAGVIYDSTIESQRFIKQIEPLKPDFLTLLAPAYFAKQMKDEVLYQYFTELADAAFAPCFVYNAPQFCGGVVLSTGLVKRLAAHPNIIGVKDSYNAASMDSYLLNIGGDFNVMAGSVDYMLTGMAMGATGGVVSIANAFPQLALDLYDLAVAKRYEEAFALNARVLRISKGVSGRGGVAAVKYAMDLAGLAGGAPRRPLLPLTEEVRHDMRAFLVEQGLL